MSPVSRTPRECSNSSSARTSMTRAAARANGASQSRSVISRARATASRLRQRPEPGRSGREPGGGVPLASPFRSSRMTPSRRPPLPICSGCPSSSETFSSRRTPVARIRTRSGSSSKRRATSAAGSPTRTLIPRSSVSYSSTAPTSRRSEVALPPTATACDGCSIATPSKFVVDPLADPADLGRRRGVGGDQLVGERPRTRSARSGPARPRPGPSRARPRSSRRRRRRRRRCPRPGGRASSSRR